MADYRAYLLNPDGKIIEAFDFVSHDDEAAKKHALDAASGQVLELWQGERQVETFKRAHG
jgi:hypothetical protein